MLFTFFLSAFAFIKKIIEARKKNYYYYLLAFSSTKMNGVGRGEQIELQKVNCLESLQL